MLKHCRAENTQLTKTLGLQVQLHNLFVPSLALRANKSHKIGIRHWAPRDFKTASLVCLAPSIFQREETNVFSSGKGNGANWGFGLGANGAPGLANSQARQTGTAATSFAQTIGSSQPATPLDLS